MVKKIFLVNHGDPGWSSKLKNESKEPLRRLADLIATQCGEGKIALVSSTASPARETARIMAERLGLDAPELNENLYSFRGQIDPHKREEIFKLIDKKGGRFETLILVTHIEYVDLFPTMWGLRHGHVIREALGTPLGAARVIDTMEGEAKPFP